MHRSFVLLVLGVLLGSSCAGWGEDDRQVDKLLTILVRRHVLTEKEAAEVRAEASQESASHGSAGETACEVPGVAPPPATAADAQTEVGSAPGPPEAVPARAEGEGLARLPFKISGYGQVRWTNQPGEDSTFRLRRARIRVTGDIGKIGTYRMEVDFVKAPSLLDAFVTLGPHPYLKFTAGQFRIPFSQESLWMSADLPMVERAQVVSKLAPGRDNGSNGRDIGVDLQGTYALTETTGVEYAFGVFNGNGINTTAVNNHKNIAARLGVRPAAGLFLAGDYYEGNTGANETSHDRAGAEYRFERGRLLAIGEFISGNDGALHRHGWYALEGWKFSPKWQAVARVDSFDADNSAKDGVGTLYLGGVNWRMQKNVRFQLNGGGQHSKGEWKPDVLSQMQFSF